MTTKHSPVTGDSHLPLLLDSLGDYNPKPHNIKMLLKKTKKNKKKTKTKTKSYQAVSETAVELFNMADSLPHSEQCSRLANRYIHVLLDQWVHAGIFESEDGHTFVTESHNHNSHNNLKKSISLYIYGEVKWMLLKIF